MKIFLILLISLQLFGAATEALPVIERDETSSAFKEHATPKVPVLRLFETVAWYLIMTEIEITLDAGQCGLIPGFRTSSIDLFMINERVNKPLHFPFIDLSMDANPIKANTSRETGANGGDTPKVQNTNSHAIYMPILGIIFKKQLDFLCLSNGEIALPYLSEFDLTYKHDYMYMKMIPHMLAMFTPSGIMTGLLDQLATMGSETVRGFKSENSTPMVQSTGASDSIDYENAINQNSLNIMVQGTAAGEDYNSTTSKFTKASLKVFDSIRNGIYFASGAEMSPIGGYQDGNDPVAESHADFHAVGNILHGASALLPIAVFKKTTEFHMKEMSGNENTPSIISSMCAPKDFPMMIPSQYVMQLSYPWVGSPHELGQIPVAVSTGKGFPGAKGVVNYVWSRREFYAFAYACPGQNAREND